MAFPTIPTVAAGRVLTKNQLDNSATRTFDAFSNLTYNDGDLLIAICVCYQSSLTSAIFSSWSNGFSEFHDSGGTNEMCVGMAYKVASGTESGSLTVTQGGTITGDASMILLSIPGAHASTPPEAGSRAVGTSAAADPASFNPTGWDAEDTLWISVVGSGMTSGTGSWTATGTTAPTNYTDRVDTNATDTSTTGDCEAAVAFRQLNAASEDVGTAGVDTSNARNVAVVVAVRPAALVNTRGRVSFSEFEAPFVNTRGRVSFAELEAPFVNTRGRLSFAELEVPAINTRGRLSFTELEVPSVSTRGRISFAELEVPTVPTRGRLSFTELEVPSVNTRGQISWSELQVPDVATATRGQISFAELEVPLVSTRGRISFAEFETPLAPTRGRISFSELETPLAPTRGRTSFAELEVPALATRGRISWSEFQVPDVGGGYTPVSYPGITWAYRRAWALLNGQHTPWQ